MNNFPHWWLYSNKRIDYIRIKCSQINYPVLWNIMSGEELYKRKEQSELRTKQHKIQLFIFIFPFLK